MARRTKVQLTALREEYLALLDGTHNEQTYQSFIEQNTELVPREFIQNHGAKHGRKRLRKQDPRHTEHECRVAQFAALLCQPEGHKPKAKEA